MSEDTDKTPEQLHNERANQGRINRRKGKEFENAVRKSMQAEGWIVIRFDQNPDVVVNELKVCKPMFLPGKGLMYLKPGFPDFICIKKDELSVDIKFVEAKINGYLTPDEQEKAAWLLKYINIPIFIAYQIKDERHHNQIRYKPAMVKPRRLAKEVY